MNIPATVDISNGRIFSADSKEILLHEQAHLKFQETSFGSFLTYLFETSQMYMLGSLSLSFFIPLFKYLSVALFIFMIFCLLYEEYWADSWAEKELKKEVIVGRVNVIERVT